MTVVFHPEKAVAPHSSTLAWKTPWTEEPARLQSMGSIRVGHDWATSLSLFTSRIGEGNGNPLQCSCLENPRDGAAWWAPVYGVAQGQTRLKGLSSSSSSSSSIPSHTHTHTHTKTYYIYILTTHLLYPCICWWTLRPFRVSAIVNDAMNVGAHVSFTAWLLFFGYTVRSGPAVSCGGSAFRPPEPPYCSPQWLCQFPLLPSVRGFPFLHILASTCHLWSLRRRPLRQMWDAGLFQGLGPEAGVRPSTCWSVGLKELAQWLSLGARWRVRPALGPEQKPGGGGGAPAGGRGSVPCPLAEGVGLQSTAVRWGEGPGLGPLRGSTGLQGSCGLRGIFRQPV